MQIVIEIPEETYTHLRNGGSIGASLLIEDAIKNGTPLPKGHGKLVDISKINEDRTDDDNPIIYLTINGEYTEAVSLDYINNLSTIVEADIESENKK